MPTTYAYKVRDRAGKLLEGSIEADSTNLVADKLRQLGYVPIAIDKRDESGISREIKIPGLGGRIKLKDTAVFSRQFATMINSGLSLLRALYILAEQTENKALAKVIGEVPVGGLVTVLSDDEAARLDIPAWCAMREQEYVGERPAERGAAYVVRRRV